MVRWIFLVAWGMHGVGHAAGLMEAIRPGLAGFKTEQPWVLPGAVSISGPIGKAWGALWLAAIASIVASVYGLATGASWWQQAAIAGAAVSLLAILPWARTVVPGALAGAAFDIFVLTVLLVPVEAFVRAVQG